MVQQINIRPWYQNTVDHKYVKWGGNSHSVVLNTTTAVEYSTV